MIAEYINWLYVSVGLYLLGISATAAWLTPDSGYSKVQWRLFDRILFAIVLLLWPLAALGPIAASLSFNRGG